MKNFDINSFNFQYILLEYAKELKLSDEEVLVVLMVEHALSKEPKSLVTPDLLALKLSAPLKTIDSVLVSLSRKSLVTTVKSGKTLYTSLKPLEILLRDKIITEIITKDRMDADEKNQNALRDTLEAFERELARPLTSVEMTMIAAWIKKYGVEEVSEAIFETKNARNQKLSTRNVEKTLLDRSIKKERKGEGRSAITNDSDMTMEEAAKVAKLNWLED